MKTSSIHRPPSTATTLRAIARSLRAMLGFPDYDRYVAHVRARHPEREPLTRAEFTRWRLDKRYSTPGARCC